MLPLGLRRTYLSAGAAPTASRSLATRYVGQCMVTPSPTIQRECFANHAEVCHRDKRSNRPHAPVIASSMAALASESAVPWPPASGISRIGSWLTQSVEVIGAHDEVNPESGPMLASGSKEAPRRVGSRLRSYSRSPNFGWLEPFDK